MVSLPGQALAAQTLSIKGREERVKEMGVMSSSVHSPGDHVELPRVGSREPTPLCVQGRPVTISQNKPKAIIKPFAPDAFLFRDPI